MVTAPRAPEARLTVVTTPQAWTWDLGDHSPAPTTSDPGGDYQ